MAITIHEQAWHDLADKHWMGAAKTRAEVRDDVVKKEIWDALEQQNFDQAALSTLEGLELLERYLWPGFNEDSIDNHVLLIAILVTTKAKHHLQTWDVFTNNPSGFATMFRRVLSLSVNTSLALPIRTHILSFLINAFQSLDNILVRKECAPLVSISLWHNLASESARETVFNDHPHLRKIWRASLKRFEAADQGGQAKMRFERSWLFSLVADFVSQLHGANRGSVEYCERFIELLTDLESQMPTRRYVNTLLNDMNILPLIKLSPLLGSPSGGLLNDLYTLLRHYISFSVDDFTGSQHSPEQVRKLHCDKLAGLQRLSLRAYKEKLTLLSLSSYGLVDQREELEGHLRSLDDEELSNFCRDLGLRTTYPPECNIKPSRDLITEVVISAHERKKTFQESIREMSVLPTETSLYEESILRNESYDGSRSLALPKLNLQYLSVGDFLWRAFILHRCEQFFEIRTYLEGILKRLQPYEDDSTGTLSFKGFSKMALPVNKAAVLEAAPPRVGDDLPAFIRAEITLNVQRLSDTVRRDWDSLRPDDSIFMIVAQAIEDTRRMTNGHTFRKAHQESGMLTVRVAEVVQILDENGRVVREPHPEMHSSHIPRPRIRRLIVHLDRKAFQADIELKEKGGVDIYDKINLVVRRPRRENNFRRVLETIQTLAASNVSLPNWLQDVFLGFGDPTSAASSNLPNRLTKLDLQDTFVDWNHLMNSFPDSEIEPAVGFEAGFGPPYVIETTTPTAAAPRLSKKRRRDEAGPAEVPGGQSTTIRVSTYKKPHMGPYPTDVPKSNSIHFTPMQSQAIASGTQPGLTLIIGPPGTGKTDVATQIISNIYHDFPKERTLLIAHSNQALNQLFQKITNLDIDKRHLLRLGQGESELETDEDYGKYGRVDSFLENRTMYLAEVDRLAMSLAAPGAHGSSCETANYFDSVYIRPAWQRFWDEVLPTSSPKQIVATFPFHQYFQNAPQPLLPPNSSTEEMLEICRGCERHIGTIFSELEDIRPFEILHNNKDKTNYLMLREARIIAMTSTHAAMRRQEFASMGFHYDNVVMEEAAQITEVENFIPLVLQDTHGDSNRLRRAVLCGDHLQNSPIIQNMAFRQFANLDQSLFLRLIRLGAPAIHLDAQGRARPSIAELYRWRYLQLKNLETVSAKPDFLRANAGFAYDFQFIDLQDYKGKGEQSPTPHFIQNLGEAEYAVALYQYMRLLGYPASKISIITPYAGQRALIRDVLNHRCAGNRLFGMPRIVATVDKYQGEQNDYIILSLVRTSRPGYLRDLRRLTVALSRARLGLYILGRRSVFENSAEISRAFALPLQRPSNLMLITGEMHPTQRALSKTVEGTEIVSVEHLGQYVYEMTQAKVNMLQEGTSTLPPQEARNLLDVDGDDNIQEEGGNDESIVDDEMEVEATELS